MVYKFIIKCVFLTKFTKAGGNAYMVKIMLVYQAIEKKGIIELRISIERVSPETFTTNDAGC
jgi:hypothetical protein